MSAAPARRIRCADCERTRHDRHPNRQAVKGIPRCALGGGDVEHDKHQREGEQKLSQKSRPHRQIHCSYCRASLQILHDNRGEDSADDLGNHIG